MTKFFQSEFKRKQVIRAERIQSSIIPLLFICAVILGAVIDYRLFN